MSTLSSGAGSAPPQNQVIRECDFMKLAAIIGIGPASSLFSSLPDNPVVRHSLQGGGHKVCVRMVRSPERCYAEVVDAPPAGSTGALVDLFR